MSNILQTPLVISPETLEVFSKSLPCFPASGLNRPEARTSLPSLPPVGGEVDTVGEELDTVGGECDTLGGQLDTVGGGLDTVGGEIDTVGGEFYTIGGKFRYGWGDEISRFSLEGLFFFTIYI